MLLCIARAFGKSFPDEGIIRCSFNDSNITNVAVEKRIGMAEVSVTMHS